MLRVYSNVTEKGNDYCKNYNNLLWYMVYGNYL